MLPNPTAEPASAIIAPNREPNFSRAIYVDFQLQMANVEKFENGDKYDKVSFRLPAH
jgi:hypothetical protein